MNPVQLHWEKDLRGLFLFSSGFHPVWLFLLVIFVLCPFTITRHIEYMLHSVSPSSEPGGTFL